MSKVKSGVLPEGKTTDVELDRGYKGKPLDIAISGLDAGRMSRSVTKFHESKGSVDGERLSFGTLGVKNVC